MRFSFQSGRTSEYGIILLGLLAGIFLSMRSNVILLVHAEETVYRCEDGLFTNRTDAGCFPYRPQGSVMVSPDGQPPLAIRDHSKPNTTTMTAVLPPPAGKVSKGGYTLCSLYEEWQTLRRVTRSGAVFRKREFARWQALSRVFLSVGTPQCEGQSTIQAAHASR